MFCLKKYRCLLAGLLFASGLSAHAQSEDFLSLSPASGTYFTSQSIDLLMLLQKSDVTIQSMTALVNNSDVSADFDQCRIQGSIVGGGISYRCPQIGLSILAPGLYTFTVFLQLSDGSAVSDSVQWSILQNTE